ncbi:MAG: hypothetical protein QMD01_09085 [Thermodesulfovibrionales bacterium]|nr:hypothetical protein [Thermodesulfovibrionales bacterium]
MTVAIVLAKHGSLTRVYEMSSDVGHRLNSEGNSCDVLMVVI